MEFINDNYIWLIIVAIVLLLAVIGFIADKNGLINEKTKEKKEAEPKVDNEPVIEEPKIEEPITTTPVAPTIPDPFEEKGEENIIADMFEEPKNISEEVKDDSNEEIQNVNNDVEVSVNEDNSLEENPFKVFESPTETDENQVEESATMENNIEDTTVEDIPTVPDFDNENEFVDSDLDGILNKKDNEELNPQIEDEEIWKF